MHACAVDKYDDELIPQQDVGPQIGPCDLCVQTHQWSCFQFGCKLAMGNVGWWVC